MDNNTVLANGLGVCGMGWVHVDCFVLCQVSVELEEWSMQFQGPSMLFSIMKVLPLT